MRSFKLIVVLILFGCVLPLSLMAQGNPPPPCCPRSSDVPVDPDDVQRPVVPVQSDMIVPLQMLSSQTITRAQFIDRLSQVLFPGKDVEIVVASRLSGAGTAAPSVTATDIEDGLLAVQETRLYRVARQRLSTQQIERLNQVYIADGELYVKVTFIDVSSYDSELAPSSRVRP
jgi:hypothetical protein